MMKTIADFEKELMRREKSKNTVNKYVRDAKMFLIRCGGINEISVEKVIEYKNMLKERYTPKSVNSMLSAVNCFLDFIGKRGCCVRLLKIQKSCFAESDRLLTKSEYQRLVNAAREKGKERLYYLLQTICATGIRVSELKFITVNALNSGGCMINMKGKIRHIFIPKKLSKSLLKYCRERKIKSGSVFITKNGNPLDRSNIWAEMKKLCETAGVKPEKVFPHNLRHLFARIYYTATKDIAKLADVLGHSSVNTTRIYVMDTGETHRKQIEKLGLLLC